MTGAYPTESASEPARVQPVAQLAASAKTATASAPVAPPAQSIATAAPTSTATAPIAPTPHDLPAPSANFQDAPAPALATASPTPKPTPRAKAAPVQEAQTFEEELLALINASRAQGGVAPVRLNIVESRGTKDCVGSYGHSVHMSTAGMAHDQYPADICLPTSGDAENIGYASGDKETALRWIHQGMMDEAKLPNEKNRGHYRNIMNPKYDSVGIGLYYSGGILWLTEDFMHLGTDQIANNQ